MTARDKSTDDRSRSGSQSNPERGSQGEIPIRGREAQPRSSEPRSGEARGGETRTGERSSRETRSTGVTRSGYSSPFGMMRQLSDEMSRFFGNFGFASDLLSSPLDTGVAVPQVDVLRRGDELVVRADLPGLSKENISIDVSDDALTIRGERRAESREEREGYYWHERSSGSFVRRIPLPDNADVDQAQAHFENGVLEVSMPAPENQHGRNRRIEIR
jgi:HSP20 family protein